MKHSISYFSYDNKIKTCLSEIFNYLKYFGIFGIIQNEDGKSL